MAEGARSHDYLFKDANKFQRLRHHHNYELVEPEPDTRSSWQKIKDYVRETLSIVPETIYSDHPAELSTSTPLRTTELSSGITPPRPETKPMPQPFKPTLYDEGADGSN